MVVLLLAFALTHIIPLSEPLKIGLILLGAAAGAPFLPKLAQFAHGNVGFGVGLMVLLMVVTIIILPLALQLLLPSVRVNPTSIAVSLVVTMLLPLSIALWVRARYPEPAGQLPPPAHSLGTLPARLPRVLRGRAPAPAPVRAAPGCGAWVRRNTADPAQTARAWDYWGVKVATSTPSSPNEFTTLFLQAREPPRRTVCTSRRRRLASGGRADS